MTVSQSPLSQATDDRLANMLFQGEEIEEEFTVGSARVAVSTHRVLVFTPDGDGRRFDHADRPNVLDARVETTGRGSYAAWGTRAGVYGAVLLGGGLLLRTSGAIDQFSTAAIPTAGSGSGVAGTLSVLPDVFAAFANALLVGGALLLVAAAAFAGLYATSRERELVVERAGRDPIRIPAGNEAAEPAAGRLRSAVGTGSKPPGD